SGERSTIDADLGRRHPLRILLAEDNPVNRKLALRLLERMGYAADVALNGREALEAVEGGAYDLVLMDVQMPEMDGLEATRQIAAMRDAAAGGEPDGVTRAAHALKGASASVGAAGLSEQARVLELDARAGRLDGAATQIEEMALELERVAAALRDA